MFRILLVCFFCVYASLSAVGQNADLARHYYQNGNYEKAADQYLSLYQDKGHINYFKSYIKNLELSNQDELALSKIEKELQKQPDEISLYVTAGGILESMGKLDEAKVYFRRAINQLPKIQYEITKIGDEFRRAGKYDLSIETYLKGLDLIKKDATLTYKLADAYRRKGNNIEMVNWYIESVKLEPYRVKSVENIMQRYLPVDSFSILQTALFDKIQSEATPEYYKLLIWSYVYTKKFPAALRQSIALDKRGSEAGKRVLQIAQTALNEEDYETAIKGFNYIIKEKGKLSPYYAAANEDLLEAKRRKIISKGYNQEDLVSLESEYQQFLDENGINKYSAGIMQDLAFLQSNYLNKLSSAISLLSNALNINDLEDVQKASIKLDLGDYYLINNERWESTLLYSQVDKDFEEDPIGHEARFKNAMLAYYMGDFDWAQAQFDILKASTSKLISNDAIDISVFMQDNIALDTNTMAMSLFSRADLFAYQHQYDSSFALLKQIKLEFPDHGLTDDIIYREAKLYYELKNYEKAIERYEFLIRNYPDEIKTDNSLFELAGIYENILGDPEKAKGLYESIFIDHEDSTFAVEARKRYRRLRGDEI